MKLKKNQFQRKEVCGSMGTYYDVNKKQMDGKSLRSKYRLESINGERNIRDKLIDDKKYNVEIHEWDDSEGFDHVSYVIMDDLNLTNTSEPTCNQPKQVYQLVFWNSDAHFNNTSFRWYMSNQLNAREIFPDVYWFETGMSVKEIYDDVKKLINDEYPYGDMFYVMQLHPNMECWMGTKNIDWFKKKMKM